MVSILTILKLWLFGYLHPFILMFRMNLYIMYLEMFFKVFFNFYWNHFLCCNFLTLVNNNQDYYCNRIPYFALNDLQLILLGITKLSFPFYENYKNNQSELKELELLLQEWI